MKVEDGATLWTRSLAGDTTQFIDVDARPVIRGDALYAGAFAVGMYSVGRKNGEIRWFHPAKGVRSPALGGDLLYFSTGDRELRALDVVTDKLVWRMKLAYGSMAAPTVAGDRVYLANGDSILLVGAATGLVEARLTPDDGQAASVAATGSWLHFVNNSGALMGARVR